MKKLILDNFRIFEVPTEIDFAPITILTGRNNSGKSSVVKGLLLLDVLLNSNDQFVLDFSEKNISKHKINSFKNALNWYSKKNTFSIGYTILNFEIEMNFSNLNESSATLYSFTLQNTKKGIFVSLEKDNASVYKLKFTENIRDYINIKSKLNGIESMLNRIKNKIHSHTTEIQKNHFKELEIERDSLLEELAILGQYNLQNEKIIESKIDLYDIQDNSKNLSEIIGLNINHYYWKLKNEENYIINNNNISNSTDELKQKLLSEFRYKKLLNQNRFDNEFSTVYFFRSILSYSVEHLSPNRTRQERLYIKNVAHTEIEHEIETFSKNYLFNQEKKFFLEKWLKEFSLGEKIIIEPIEGVAYKVKITNLNKQIDLVDMGFGSGQILTILLKISNVINTNNNFKKFIKYSGINEMQYQKAIIIEEPESNLHPQFQSKMAELIAESAIKYNVQFIIETHSEYFIRKLQLIVANNNYDVKNSDVIIYYMDNNNSNKREKINKISVLKNGSLSSRFGSGFLDEATNHALELMKFKNNISEL